MKLVYEIFMLIFIRHFHKNYDFRISHIFKVQDSSDVQKIMRGNQVQ